jgi:putative spermidine/putrescine transport system permease protein
MSALIYRVALIGFYVFLLSPLAVIVVVSFGAGSAMEFPPRSLSLEWYARALNAREFTGPLINSAMLGVAAAVTSAVIGIITALALVQGRHHAFRNAIEAFVLSPLIVPGVVLGIALLITFTDIGLRNSWSRLFLAHLLITFPYCVRTTMVSLARLDPAYGEAAESLGATRFETFIHVTLPLIAPGVVAGLLFAFVVSFDNVPTTIFLTDHSTTTLPIAIMAFIQYDFNPSIASISSMIIVVMIIFSVVIERLVGLRRMFGA